MCFKWWTFSVFFLSLCFKSILNSTWWVFQVKSLYSIWNHSKGHGLKDGEVIKSWLVQSCICRKRKAFINTSLSIINQPWETFIITCFWCTTKEQRQIVMDSYPELNKTENYRMLFLKMFPHSHSWGYWTSECLHFVSVSTTLIHPLSYLNKS